MDPIPLHYVWHYNDVDRAFWQEHLEDWLPPRILDAHTHVVDPALRRAPMTPEMRRQYWVSEVFEPISAADADRCHRTVFPGRAVACLAFGMPDLDFDLEAGNDNVQRECAQRGWWGLMVIQPQWSADRVAQFLRQPGVVGVKPYYALISPNRATRDAHLEAGIFDFLPHHLLEVVDHYHAWVTLHVPKAARLGHADNQRDIRELRRRYPSVKLVIAHLGRAYTEPHAREGLVPLADDPGIYFDTAAVLNPACHRIALEHAGPDRIIYGSDNPIMYMRGRRQYRDRTYINRTNHPFQFNLEREPPEIEAGYTLYLYEDIRAIKLACVELGMTDAATRSKIFHGNAARLIASVDRRKQEL